MKHMIRSGYSKFGRISLSGGVGINGSLDFGGGGYPQAAGGKIGKGVGRYPAGGEAVYWPGYWQVTGQLAFTRKF